MLTIIASSKTQQRTLLTGVPATEPALHHHAQRLAAYLQGCNESQLASLMGISERLAQATASAYRAFTLPHHRKNAGHALASFTGDVFAAIQPHRYAADDLLFANRHLRILSGLYGILRPLDLLQPYRLEMAYKIPVNESSSLYDYWSTAVTDTLNRELADHRDPVIVNCASQEYARVIDGNRLTARLLTVVFKQRKNDALRTIALHAKRARGQFVDWLIVNRIDRPDHLVRFDRLAYRFAPDQSRDDQLVFITELP